MACVARCLSLYLSLVLTPQLTFHADSFLGALTFEEFVHLVNSCRVATNCILSRTAATTNWPLFVPSPPLPLFPPYNKCSSLLRKKGHTYAQLDLQHLQSNKSQNNTRGARALLGGMEVMFIYKNACAVLSPVHRWCYVQPRHTATCRYCNTHKTRNRNLQV